MPIVVQRKKLTPTDVNRLYSLLHGCGVSFVGAQQLLKGLIVTSPGDRQAIGRVFSQVSAHELERIGFIFQKIEWTGDSSKMSMDDWNTSP